MIRLIPYDPTDTALRSAIKGILIEGFGAESASYYDLMLDHLHDREHTFLLEEGGVLVSHALVVDYYEPSGQRWGYLYSFVTTQDYRGRGLMSRLYLEEIEPTLRDRGYEGVCLVPAESSLVPFYERWGTEVMPRLPENEGCEILPGPQAEAYLMAAYGETRIVNPLPFRMVKPFTERTDPLVLVSPLD